MMSQQTVEFSKIDTDRRQVFGWAYISHDNQGEVVVDKSGDFVDDPQNLEDAAYRFVLTSRSAGHNHQRIQKDEPKVVGTLIESIYFNEEKISKLGIPAGILPTSAWWIGFQIEDDAVWQDVKNGRLKAWSIHGTGKREPV